MFRFASRYLFDIDQNILEVLQDSQIFEAFRLKISKERVGKELQPALEHVNCAFFANQLHSVGLMPVVFEVPVKMTDERASHLKIGELIGSNQKTWNCVMKTAEDMQPILMKEHVENPDNLRLNLMLSAILNNTQTYAVAKGVCLSEYLVKHGMKVGPGLISADQQAVRRCLRHLEAEG